MRRTFLLLLAATLVMAGLVWSGRVDIPWWVVLTPVMVPLLAWLGLSVLAVGLSIAAFVMDRTARALEGRRRPE